ncbi:MAG: hypothetical protein M1834_001233 [Cirrosporium novae-zelandiae]|nr:MAG: hypothetical protein M1834_001233 [Cirrosporium novae-zelandiae]
MQPTLAPAPPHTMQHAPSDHAFDQSEPTMPLTNSMHPNHIVPIMTPYSYTSFQHSTGLRDQLLATQNTASSPQQPHHSLENMQPSSSASPREHGNIDPAIAGSGMMGIGAGNNSDGNDNNSGGDGRKTGKRELSTSKRAAQNRAAQRAFRQRKEGYIKKLEEQVRDYSMLSENFKTLQAENYQLRDYIINLQSRLIESQGEVPQPPIPIEVQQPPPPGAPGQQQPGGTANQMQQQMGTQGSVSATPMTANMGAAPIGPSAVSQLQASAAQAVDLGGTGKHQHEEAAYLAGNEFPSKRLKQAMSNPAQSSGRPGQQTQSSQLGVKHDPSQPVS